MEYTILLQWNLSLWWNREIQSSWYNLESLLINKWWTISRNYSKSVKRRRKRRKKRKEKRKRSDYLLHHSLILSINLKITWNENHSNNNLRLNWLHLLIDQLFFINLLLWIDTDLSFSFPLFFFLFFLKEASSANRLIHLSTSYQLDFFALDYSFSKWCLSSTRNANCA